VRFFSPQGRLGNDGVTFGMEKWTPIGAKIRVFDSKTENMTKIVLNFGFIRNLQLL